MVVGDLGTGVGGDGQQGGLAHVGEAYQAHVCQQLQLQDHFPLLSFETGFGKPGDLPGGGGVVGIAPTAAAALGNDMIFTGGHVHDDLIGLRVPDYRAPGDLDDQRFAPLAAHLSALTVFAGLGSILALIAEIQKGCQIVVDTQNDTAAVTAVAAVGTAGCYVFFPVKGNCAVTAATAADGDVYFIYKHGKTSNQRSVYTVMNSGLSARFKFNL